METTDIIALVCVGVAVGYVAYTLYLKAKKGGCGCGSGDGGCCGGGDSAGSGRKSFQGANGGTTGGGCCGGAGHQTLGEKPGGDAVSAKSECCSGR